MNREMLCSKCGEESIRRHGLMRQYHYSDGEEFVRHVRGVANRDAPEGDPIVNGEVVPWVGPMVCDNCSTPIPKGAPAVARTIGVGTPALVVPWESTHLDPTPD